MSIHTFSGTHPWHPSVLADTDADADAGGNADNIIDDIENGTCPRCWGALPQLPEYPAGSRITECRSIPICGPCGGDEFYEILDCLTGNGFGLSAASCWPLSWEEIEERRSRYERQMTPAILTGDQLITKDGVGQVINPRNTGGWAQYGFQDGNGPD